MARTKQKPVFSRTPAVQRFFEERTRKWPVMYAGAVALFHDGSSARAGNLGWELEPSSRKTSIARLQTVVRYRRAVVETVQQTLDDFKTLVDDEEYTGGKASQREKLRKLRFKLRRARTNLRIAEEVLDDELPAGVTCARNDHEDEEEAALREAFGQLLRNRL